MEKTIGKKFYDTCALLSLINDKEIFNESFYISSITLHELEHIKTSKNKDEETRYKARKITHLLDENYNNFKVIVYNYEISDFITELGLDYTIPDNQIVGTAKYLSNREDIIFITNDICLKNIARSIGLKTSSVEENKDNIYKGYRVINGNTKRINEEMENRDLSDWCVNEYLII